MFFCSACDAAPPADAGPMPDAGADAYVDPSTIVVRYDPDGEGFYRMPWPSDARMTADGTPDMSDFPMRPRNRSIDRALDEIEARVFGFATMPVAYFALTSSIDESSLPQNLAAMEEDSPIQMIDLSAEGCGARIPLEISFAPVGDELRDDNVLQIANAIGTLLTPGRPYGVIILRSFGSAESRSAPRPEAFDRALAGGDDALARSLEPLRTCLPNAGVALDDVAVATVFTPQDPVAELRALRDFVMDPARVETRAVSGWRRSDGWSRRRLSLETYLGQVQMPIFQEGTTPYESEGGALVFEGGTPVVQRWEEVDVAVAMATGLPDPPQERPVLVFMDGTGWTPWGHLGDNWIREALAAGFVVMSFMPQFHGGRAGFDGSTELSTFNVPNPEAVRANFRQQSAETSYFVRLIREQIRGLPGLPMLDTDHIVYGGHSQGALAGGLTAAVETEYAAYVFNGASSYLTLTVIHRMDIVNFAEVVSLLYNYRGELDRWSPLLQMMQLGGDVVDPHNYAARWHGWSELPNGNHVFVVNGREDDTTTPRGIEQYTMAADMPPIAPPGWEIDPVGVWDGVPVPLPVMGNEVALSGDPLTIATFLDVNGTHGTIYRRAIARELAVNFWTSALSGVPRLSTNAEYQCGDDADDDLDGQIDCDDPDCVSTPPCVEGPCDNMMDDDGNGQTDCDDPVCSGAENCQEMACDDGDDDGDGLADCMDPDCARRVPCGEQACRDGIDGDGDGAMDCADSECASDMGCHERNCGNGADDDGDGDVDCADDECRRTTACPEVMCTDGGDEDMDTFVDCDDPDCEGTTACPHMFERMCTGGADDDGDALSDCNDADCALMCRGATCADGDLGDQVGAYIWAGTLMGAGDDYPVGDCVTLGGGDAAPDVALLWTAPSAGTYEISTQGSEHDTVLSVLGPDCDPLVELACDDDDETLATSRTSVTVVAGQSIVIVIGAYDAEEDVGLVRLHILRRP